MKFISIIKFVVCVCIWFYFVPLSYGVWTEEPYSWTFRNSNANQNVQLIKIKGSFNEIVLEIDLRNNELAEQIFVSLDISEIRVDLEDVLRGIIRFSIGDHNLVKELIDKLHEIEPFDNVEVIERMKLKVDSELARVRDSAASSAASSVASGFSYNVILGRTEEGVSNSRAARIEWNRIHDLPDYLLPSGISQNSSSDQLLALMRSSVLSGSSRATFRRVEINPGPNTQRLISINQQLYRKVEISEMGGNEKCPICIEPFEKQIAEGKEVVQVNCGASTGGHYFCKACIEESIYHKSACPICCERIHSAVDIARTSQNPLVVIVPTAVLNLEKLYETSASEFCEAKGMSLLRYRLQDLEENQTYGIVSSDFNVVTLPQVDEGMHPHQQFKELWCFKDSV